MQRKSKNREKIMELFSKEHLLSARDCHKKLQEMDLATIYRNIKQLVEAGILKEVHINKEEIHYELNENHHQHLICNNCGKVDSIDISSTKLTNLVKTPDFEIEDVELNIIGKCKDCT